MTTGTLPAVQAPAVARPRRHALLAAVRLVRPRQWSKNTFVLAPLVFAGRMDDAGAVRAAAAAFVLFSLAAAWGYIVNDLLDREQDRLHPTKRHRPFASGALSAQTGVVLVPVLLGG
ncbi:MAG: UbiA family prenyltransferase, partial [Gemmatimonadetes bacterium]|nr:UbiA family prenyltransferase [Gemmatimonadota bacterium]